MKRRKRNPTTYLVFQLSTYVDPREDGSGWHTAKFYVRAKTDLASESDIRSEIGAAEKAIQNWIRNTEISKAKGLKFLGLENSAPKGIYANVMDESGQYVDPDKR